MDLVYDTPEPVAAIDIGTNSVKCLVARITNGKVADVLLDSSTTTRLGERLGATGHLSPIAIERTANTVAELAASAHRLGAQRIRVTGTSAAREAANPDDLAHQIGDLCGLKLEILPGQEEARLAYLGAVGTSAQRSAIIDVGGGSTEWAVGDSNRVTWSRSYPVGAVRCTEAHFYTDPPTPSEVESASRCAQVAFNGVPEIGTAAVVAVGGTARMVALVALAGHGSAEGHAITLVELHRQIALYSSMDLIHRREIPGLEANRAEIILAGAIILTGALAQAGISEAKCTLRGLRHGVVLELGAGFDS
jgi:exopolyphosphatase / guanosine-5'-triphosphate,3'-diphosphate pyrophosphatase